MWKTELERTFSLAQTMQSTKCIEPEVCVRHSKIEYTTSSSHSWVSIWKVEKGTEQNFRESYTVKE
jgi:hypothetical protein